MTTSKQDRKANRPVPEGAVKRESIEPQVFTYLKQSLLDQPSNDFLHSLCAYVHEKGYLTSRQHDALVRNYERDRAPSLGDVLDDSDVMPNATAIFGRIADAFNKAESSGLTKRKLRFDGMTLKAAGEHSVNKGFIYVTRIHGKDGEIEQYLGKLDSTGKAFLRKGHEYHQAVERLTAINADPTKAAIEYGRATGNCCCCNRELTNPKSIEAGIGPICAEKWGL